MPGFAFEEGLQLSQSLLLLTSPAQSLSSAVVGLVEGFIAAVPAMLLALLQAKGHGAHGILIDPIHPIT